MQWVRPWAPAGLGEHRSEAGQPVLVAEQLGPMGGTWVGIN